MREIQKRECLRTKKSPNLVLQLVPQLKNVFTTIRTNKHEIKKFITSVEFILKLPF